MGRSGRGVDWTHMYRETILAAVLSSCLSRSSSCIGQRVGALLCSPLRLQLSTSPLEFDAPPAHLVPQPFIRAAKLPRVVVELIDQVENHMKGDC